MREYGPAVLRLSLGAVFIVHGVEKLFGLWGGGLVETAAFVTSLRLPAAYPVAVASAAAELAAGILLLVGAFTLWTAIALVIARVGIFYKAYLVTGALVHPSEVGRNGFEVSVLLIGGLLAIILMGPGALSFDERREQTAERAAAARARIRGGRV
jgi:putative oxidoreductase